VIEELRALARAVAHDRSLRVELGEPGGGWSLEPATHIVRCDPLDLQREHPDEARGLVCHEAAHAAVTRYPSLVPPHLMEEPATAALLNALEDCRIEAWLAARFPGAAPWIERYNARLFPEEGHGLGGRPLTHQFALGAIYDWWHGRLPEGLDPRVVQRLEATRSARKAVVDASPPLRPEPGLVPGYEGSAVARCFAAHDRHHPPDGFERRVRLAAHAAWQIVWRDVLPAYEELLRIDRVERKDLDAQHASLLRQLHAHVAPVITRPARRGSAREGGGAGPGEASLPTVEAPARDALDQIVGQAPVDAYEAARRQVAPLAGAMTDELLRVLRAEAFPHFRGGHATGARPDLMAVMQAAADPRRRRKVWQRKTLPRKRFPVLSLLVDLSGSMEGERIASAMQGTVLLCEVLHKLQVPFAVAGFQDQLLPIKAFGEPLSGGVRARLGTMEAEVRGRHPGGHNRPEHNWDGPVLRAAADALLAERGNERVLLVVSDGQPSGPRDPQATLRQAVAEVEADGRVHLVGLGLGPGTGHVARYYAHHAAAVPLPAFPSTLGRVLRSCLGGRP
jgi:hypothetical protein